MKKKRKITKKHDKNFCKLIEFKYEWKFTLYKNKKKLYNI